jgi:hypothetical protein
MKLRKHPDIGPETAESHGSQGHETVKYGHDSLSTGLGTKNDCAGKGQQQFTRPAVLERRQRRYRSQKVLTNPLKNTTLEDFMVII